MYSINQKNEIVNRIQNSLQLALHNGWYSLCTPF